MRAILLKVMIEKISKYNLDDGIYGIRLVSISLETNNIFDFCLFFIFP